MKGIRVDPGRPDGPRRGGRDLGRVRRRDAGVRPGDDRRRHLDDRHRRPDARRRRRLAERPLRPGLRQPHLRRRRHRRRAAAARPASTENAGPVLGRCAAAAATSASSRRSSTGCTRSGRRCWAARCSTRRRARATCCASTASSAPASRTSSRPTRGCSRAPTARPLVGLVPCYSGPPEQGERLLERAARVRSAGRRHGRAPCPTWPSSACSTTRSRPAATTTGSRA